MSELPVDIYLEPNEQGRLGVAVERREVPRVEVVVRRRVHLEEASIASGYGGLEANDSTCTTASSKSFCRQRRKTRR